MPEVSKRQPPASGFPALRMEVIPPDDEQPGSVLIVLDDGAAVPSTVAIIPRADECGLHYGRLFCAAPDLLGACKLAAQDHVFHLRACHEAIAKAEGAAL